MTWYREFISQAFDRLTYRHKELPVYITEEFDFFRCVEFRDEFYGKTVSYLFNENLRKCIGRYSKLFPNQKLSYWADSADTARLEIKKHGAENNILTFWAYDDGTSHDLTVAEYKVQQETEHLKRITDILDEKQGRLYSASIRLEQAEKEVTEAEKHLSDTQAELVGAEKDLIRIKTESRETKQKLLAEQEEIKQENLSLKGLSSKVCKFLGLWVCQVKCGMGLSGLSSVFTDIFSEPS